MTNKETMKLALEALQANQPVKYCVNNNGEKFPMFSNDPLRQERNAKAITALEEALAQPTNPTGQAPCARHCEATAFQITIRSLQREIERLTAPVQEPVAWMYESVRGNDFATRNKPPDYAKNIRPLYTTPAAAQPPQRKPLTPEAIDKMWQNFRTPGELHEDDFSNIVRETEAAHGIKGAA